VVGAEAYLILDTVETIDRQKVTNPAMVESKDHPFPEFLKVKVDFSWTSTIELWIFY
jgi:hypothetical protein